MFLTKYLFPLHLYDVHRKDLSPAEYDNYGKMYQTFQRLLSTYETEPDNCTRSTPSHFPPTPYFQSISFPLPSFKWPSLMQAACPSHALCPPNFLLITWPSPCLSARLSHSLFTLFSSLISISLCLSLHLTPYLFFYLYLSLSFSISNTLSLYI